MNIRISNLPRESLVDLWKNLTNQEFDELIKDSNDKELSLLFGHMPEQGVSDVLSGISKSSLNKIFLALPIRSINKILLLSNNKVFSRIRNQLDNPAILRVIKASSNDQRERFLQMFPVDERRMLIELVDEESSIERDTNYYLGKKFDNSLERDAIARIQEIEEKERAMERRLRAREEQYSAQIEHLREQVSSAEKELHQRQVKFRQIENDFLKKEISLKDSIKALNEEHQRQVQEKIEVKVPEFVKSALELLEKKESGFAEKSKYWNRQGNIALGLAILSAIVSLVYGGFEFNAAAKQNIDWFFFAFLLIKGLVVITLFGAWASHAFNIGNAYMHESLKRSDRMHAINFGKLYLEVYGNDVSQSDMKSIFENWNLSSDSAFTKVRYTNFEPKLIEQMTQLVKSVSSNAQTELVRSKSEFTK